MGGAGHILRGVARVAAMALPPRCPGCGLVVDADHRFCARCWGGLRFLGDPACAACRLPFDHHCGARAQCAACIASPPRHSGIFAAVAYGPTARDIVLRLKYGGRGALAETIGRLVARQVPGHVELLVPVPLHRRRLWSRGFNQASLIAHAVSRCSVVPHDPFALRRTRATPPLRGLGRRERAKMVGSAFDVPAPARKRIAGRSIALVDDVYTSGATTDACTRALLRAGAARVTILCWARVIESDDDMAGDDPLSAHSLTSQVAHHR
ncbi:Amidophosphoribosyltransferase [Sphingomonas sp. EC-HK361]|uniref:ComF family protein n=1 Tax=Sphingomonas sp. EC-HK361 TaxID=2038397 RepID=UPI00125A4670|nr:ComF family protein [Sphingomonas sp. EC-HK361]VVT13520.1 Amidophosphoribosyltransferase [Sphingomonas sp. EC-HK361]